MLNDPRPNNVQPPGRRCGNPVPLGCILSQPRTGKNCPSGYLGVQRVESLEETDRHRGGTLSRLLQSGGLSPGLLRKEFRTTLLQDSDRAENCEAARALTRETETIIVRR